MSLAKLRHRAAAGLILAAFLAGPAFADKPDWVGGGKPERAQGGKPERAQGGKPERGDGPQERGDKRPDKRIEQGNSDARGGDARGRGEERDGAQSRGREQAV